MDLSVFDSYKQVPKAWGREIWLVNGPLYCAKLLVLTEGQQCSLHRHKIKDETFFMLEGAGIYVEFLSHEDSRHNVRALLPGESQHIYPFTYHRFWSPEGPAILLEVSTQHSDDDVERLEESGPIASSRP
jgi:D-lyxose ketol-isomerase